MNIRQVIQTSQTKTNELFAKLFDTSPGAVKTREKLFGELQTELALYADLEEKHLFPVLKKHKETKDLVPAASKANSDLRATLVELDAIAKDDEEFIRKLHDVKRTFQHHVRDEKKELLPAVFRALSDEEVQEVAGKIEAGRAETEQANRDRAENERAAARRERERADQQAAEQAAAERAQKAAERQAREAARTASEELEKTAAAARDEVRQLTDKAADHVRGTAVAMVDTVEIYRDAARDTGQNLRAMATFSQGATRGMTEIGSAWMEWMGASTSARMQLSQRLLRCRTMQELASTQREFLAESTRNWREHNAHVLEISRRVADDGLRAFAASPNH